MNHVQTSSPSAESRGDIFKQYTRLSVGKAIVLIISGIFPNSALTPDEDPSLCHYLSIFRRLYFVAIGVIYVSLYPEFLYTSNPACLQTFLAIGAAQSLVNFLGCCCISLQWLLALRLR